MQGELDKIFRTETTAREGLPALKGEFSKACASHSVK